MKTQCNPEQLLFQDLEQRNIIVQNDAETASSDGGLLLLRQIDRKYRITERLQEAFNDFHRQSFTQHSLSTLLRQRIFGILELRYKTKKSWKRARNVVAKAEHLPKGSNPRFIVTNIDTNWWPAKKLYENLYCARGNMENRIKKQKLDLFSDKASKNRLRTNHLRLWFSSFAYFFALILRRAGLSNTAMCNERLSTIRLKLLKIAALIKISVRRVLIRFPRSFPY